MEGIVKFWSDIVNVEGADPADIQSDVLAYLRELKEAREKLERAEVLAKQTAYAYGIAYRTVAEMRAELEKSESEPIRRDVALAIARQTMEILKSPEEMAK